MKIHREFAQRSVEWMLAHVGIPTASEWGNLLTPEWKIRKGGMPDTYLCKKVAEKWLDGPLPGFGTFVTEQGNILEDEAIPWYEFEFGERIDRVGFCVSDDGLTGCSPDGLFGATENSAEGGIEIKCPAAYTHVGYLLDGVVPDEYLAQVHGCMFVTGAKWWKFLSYRRNFPALILTVERDEEIQEKIAEALAIFLARFQAANERLEEINCGPSENKHPAFTPGPIRFSWENDAIGVTP
ncbi:MAG: YqaJ viral recombinase family protein [Patescibacteria group bacterium]|nr:YqaJ viral recombinase family protein [Patescibacteria group bacterium]